MKYLAVTCLVIILLISFASVSYADDALIKLGRGLANVATAPFEVFKGMGDATKEDGIIAGFTVGLFKGIFNMGRRATVGVYEVGTFPIPLPGHYAPVIDDPEYFFEDEEEGSISERERL